MAQKEQLTQITQLPLHSFEREEVDPSKLLQPTQELPAVEDPTGNSLLIVIPAQGLQKKDLVYVYDPGEDEEEDDKEDTPEGRYHERKSYDEEGDEANWAVEDMLREIARQRGLIP